jgi:surfeit locus 1 family protein
MSIVYFFSPRWRWVTLVVILGMAFLVRLGFWQLDRLEWRRGLNVAKAAEMNADALILNGDLSGLLLEEMANRAVSAVGEYDFDNQFLIESQIFESEPGRYLLTPLLLDGSELAVLVNRGWIPDAESDFAKYDEPGTIQIVGRIQRSEILSGDRKTQVDGNRIFRIDVGAAAENLPYPVLPIYLLPETDEVLDLTLPYLPIADLTIDEGSHLSYAIQWFAFAILLAVMYGAYINRQESKNHAQ